MTATEDDSVRLLIDLVSTPSVSGNEADAVGVFGRHAQRLGLDASIDEAGNGLALRPATGSETHRVVLLGHIDTVPGDSPIGVVDGVLHGRGAVDAKGPLCAFLMAASALTLPEGVAVEVIAAVGEETPDSPGATHVRDLRAPAACIIGEPSGFDGVTIGRTPQAPKSRRATRSTRGGRRSWAHSCNCKATRPRRGSSTGSRRRSNPAARATTACTRSPR